MVGYIFESKDFSRIDIDTNESDPAYSLAGQLMGLPLKPLQGFGVPAESYGFANKLLAWETIAPLLDTFPERFRKRATTFGGFDYDAIPQSALDVSEQERLATYEGLWNLGPRYTQMADGGSHLVLRVRQRRPDVDGRRQS